MHDGLPACAQALSMGVHESQSLLWERMVALSLPFSRYLAPKLAAAFPQLPDLQVGGICSLICCIADAGELDGGTFSSTCICMAHVAARVACTKLAACRWSTALANHSGFPMAGGLAGRADLWWVHRKLHVACC